jgi:hypothetical protein
MASTLTGRTLAVDGGAGTPPVQPPVTSGAPDTTAPGQTVPAFTPPHPQCSKNEAFAYAYAGLYLANHEGALAAAASVRFGSGITEAENERLSWLFMVKRSLRICVFVLSQKMPEKRVWGKSLFDAVSFPVVAGTLPYQSASHARR